MKKRILSLFLVFTMLMAFAPIVTAQAASINVGEYVQMGTYYGQPILWRCVDKDENGPLMLADKIICLKSFDADGDNETGSHSRNSDRKSAGSNYWADSNMRSWLNSAESAGNVNWLCGNPPTDDKVWDGYNDYANEAGFLTNFSQKELNAIKTVTQKSLVSYPESDNGIYATGTELHTYNNSIDNIVANYDTAYAEDVTDKMFLLDVKQVNAVYNNGNILGEDYYIGTLSAEAVENSEYNLGDNYEGDKWYYGLRSPVAVDRYCVCYVFSNGHIQGTYADGGDIGVRPAFYLNLQSAIFKSGSGTSSNPYTVEGTGSGDDSNSTSDGAPSTKLTYDGSSYDITQLIFKKAILLGLTYRLMLIGS